MISSLWEKMKITPSMDKIFPSYMFDDIYDIYQDLCNNSLYYTIYDMVNVRGRDETLLFLDRELKKMLISFRSKDECVLISDIAQSIKKRSSRGGNINISRGNTILAQNINYDLHHHSNEFIIDMINDDELIMIKWTDEFRDSRGMKNIISDIVTSGGCIRDNGILYLTTDDIVDVDMEKCMDRIACDILNGVACRSLYNRECSINIDKVSIIYPLSNYLFTFNDLSEWNDEKFYETLIL